jgi:hypothetical protein
MADDDDDVVIGVRSDPGVDDRRGRARQPRPQLLGIRE